MNNTRSHFASIVLAILIIVGMLMLPTMNSLSLQSLFTVVWLILALLAFGAHVQRARLFVSRGSSRNSSYQRVRRRA